MRRLYYSSYWRGFCIHFSLPSDSDSDSDRAAASFSARDDRYGRAVTRALLFAVGFCLASFLSNHICVTVYYLFFVRVREPSWMDRDSTHSLTGCNDLDPPVLACGLPFIISQLLFPPSSLVSIHRPLDEPGTVRHCTTRILFTSPSRFSISHQIYAIRTCPSAGHGRRRNLEASCSHACISVA